MKNKRNQTGSKPKAQSAEVGGNSSSKVTHASNQDDQSSRTAERLREYEKVVEGVEEMIAVVDRNYRYLLANRAFLRYRRKERQDVVGRFIWEVFDPNAFQKVIRPRLDECFAGHVVNFEMQYVYDDSGPRDLMISYFPIEGENGVERAACVLQDITIRKRAEEAVKQSEHQMAEAQRLAHVGSWSWEIETDVLSWSEELYTIFGEDPESFRPTYTSFLAHVHPDEREATALAIAQGLKDQQPFSYRRRIVRPDGEIRTIDSHINIVADPNGQPLRMFGACQDVTENLLAEEARRIAEQKYQEIFENAREGIFRTTPDGHYLVGNSALARMHGFDSPEDLIRERTDIPHDVYVDPARRDEFKRLIETDGGIQGFEFQLARKDGATIWVSVNARAVRDENGTIQYYEGSAEDITERKMAEEERARLADEIEHQRRRLDNIVSTVPGVVWEAWGQPDLATQQIDYVSDYVETMLGYTVDEWLSTPNFWLTIVHPDDRERAAKAAAKAFANREAATMAFRWIRKDGSDVWVESSATVVTNEAGEPVGVRGVAVDISEQKRAEAELRFQKSLSESQTEASIDGILVVSSEQKLLSYNRRFVEIWNVPNHILETKSDELALNHVLENVADPQEFLSRVKYLYDHPQEESRDEIQLTDGRTLDRYSAPITSNQGDNFGRVWFFRDITERKRAEEALLQSEERYRELFENSRDAIYVHDLSGRYTSVNRAAEELSGYTREEVLGKHYSNFVLPTQLKIVREHFCRKLDVPLETTYETQIACKDGSRRPVEVSSRMVYRNGEPAGVQGTVRDITERRRAQRALQIYSRRLVNAQEAEREVIARELHDDIGQSLTAISINLEWIHRSGAVHESAVPRLRESIDVIDNALRRVRELSFELRPALLDDLGLAAALTWYAARFSERTGIRANVTGELPGPEGIGRTVETACFRIVQEALTNTARYARASEASIHVERNNGMLKLTIADNGVGFAVEAFVGPNRFTNALGLRGMEERASAVGGRVTIVSEQDKGTQVILRVPTSSNLSS